MSGRRIGHPEMKTTNNNKPQIITSLLDIDYELIRALIVLEIISRSIVNFQEVIKGIFGRTWEYRILRLFTDDGPLNKSQLSLKLFPISKDRHYRLSRSNDSVSRGFSYLLKNGIIVLVEKSGRMKLYNISPKYKPILRVMFRSNVSAQPKSY